MFLGITGRFQLESFSPTLFKVITQFSASGQVLELRQCIGHPNVGYQGVSREGCCCQPIPSGRRETHRISHNALHGHIEGAAVDGCGGR